MHQSYKGFDESWTNLLCESRLGHLATCNLSLMPHVVPICYVFHEGAIYSSVDEKPKRTKPACLRRIINIKENPNVCLVIDHYEENWRRLRFLIVQGRAKLLQSGKEYQQAIIQLRKKYPQYRFMNLQTRPIIKIFPTKLRAWKSENKYRRPKK